MGHGELEQTTALRPDRRTWLLLSFGFAAVFVGLVAWQWGSRAARAPRAEPADMGPPTPSTQRDARAATPALSGSPATRNDIEDAYAGRETDAVESSDVVITLLHGSDERPLAGANASLFADGHGWLARGTSGEDGRLIFRNLPCVPVRLDTDRDRAFEFTLHPGVNEYSARFPSGLGVRGRVLDPIGRPVPGAIIACFTWPRLVRLPIAGTDDGGEFSIVAVPEFSYLVALHDELAPSEPLPIRRGDLAHPVELRLGPPGAYLSASLRSSSDESIAGGEVWLQPFEGPDPPRNLHEAHSTGLVLHSDEAGNLRSRALPLGTWLISARARGEGSCSEVLTVQAPGLVSRTIRMRPGTALLGEVLAPDGRPIPGASIVASGIGLDSHRGRTDDRGAFALEDLPSGALSVRASASGYASRELSLEPLERGNLEIRLEPGSSLRGRLRTELGQPLSGWTVGAAPANGPSELWASATRTSPDGSYSLEVSAGEYRLETRDPRSRLSPVLVLAPSAVPGPEPLPDFLVDPDDLALCEFRGKLIDPQGRAPSDAVIRIASIGSPDARGPVSVDPDGNFAVGPLRRGDYELQVEALGLASGRFGPYQLSSGERRELGLLRLESRN